MNLQYKKGQLKNDNSSDESLLDFSDDEYGLCYKRKRKNEISTIKTLASSNFSDEDNYSNLLNQNLINYDKVIKLLIIGQSQCGKTLFLNKILNIEKEIQKTEFLDIKSKVVEINNENVKVEFWDCNEKFLTSPLINVYYKIANAFIIIVDENSDLNFIKNQIVNIQLIKSDAKFFFLFNNKYNKNLFEFKEKYETFCKNNYLDFNQYNISKLFFNHQMIQDFFEDLI